MYLVEELNQLGVWQMVMCPFNSSVHKYCLKHHINHVTYFKGFSANPMVAFRVNHICRREAIDLIHVHDSHAHNFAILSAVISKNDRPIVVSRRVDFPVQSGKMSNYKYNHPQIAKIICVSDAIKEVMKPDIEDQQKLVTVHSGVDLNKFDTNDQEQADLREELGIPPSTKLIGNVSALAPHKDYGTFIKTAQLAIQAGLDAKFLAIGDGPLRKQVAQAVHDAGLEDHVLLLGFRSDVVDILPQLDAFLITSKTEGLGTSILDAQAAGIPIVATNAGGIVEIVKHEQTGLLADVADASGLSEQLVKLMSNASLRRELVAQAKAQVQQYSKQETARKTKAIYEEVLLDRESRKPDVA